MCRPRRRPQRQGLPEPRPWARAGARGCGEAAAARRRRCGGAAPLPSSAMAPTLRDGHQTSAREIGARQPPRRWPPVRWRGATSRTASRGRFCGAGPRCRSRRGAPPTSSISVDAPSVHTGLSRRPAEEQLQTTRPGEPPPRWRKRSRRHLLERAATRPCQGSRRQRNLAGFVAATGTKRRIGAALGHHLAGARGPWCRPQGRRARPLLCPWPNRRPRTRGCWCGLRSRISRLGRAARGFASSHRCHACGLPSPVDDWACHSPRRRWAQWQRRLVKSPRPALGHPRPG
mmetsp:Transcript_15834/g.43764  ORF Transcript_15834/g.43764 Transcript_15834/m.43764 type:complete len:288 (-) Transcript_15834:563-1426(-)